MARHHYPGEFLCALLNAQPMGFYPPASLVRDARRRGVEVLPPDVNRSEAKCRLERDAVRVGIGYVKGLGQEPATALVEERAARRPFASVSDLALRAPLDRARARGARRQRELRLLRLAAPAAPVAPRARAEVRQRRGRGRGRQLALPLGRRARSPELAEQTPWERMLADYRLTSLSVGLHPLELLRPHLPGEVLSSADLEEAPHGARVSVAGLAVARQRPATASGVVFMLIEDEHGQMNLIIPPPVYDRHRASFAGSPCCSRAGASSASSEIGTCSCRSSSRSHRWPAGPPTTPRCEAPCPPRIISGAAEQDYVPPRIARSSARASGLTIVHAIVRAHEGAIEVTHEGQGTTFRVRLPVAGSATEKVGSPDRSAETVI